jgi:glycerol kinase
VGLNPLTQWVFLLPHDNPAPNMEKYVLALDAGTTSSRAILFRHDGTIAAFDQSEFEQIYPQPGWVEHNAMDIWTSQLNVARGVMQKHAIGPEQLDSIGIANQRETTVVWNKKTGAPVGNAIVWQDRRSAARCEQLKKEGLDTYIKEKTGLVLDAYFSSSKLEWILHNRPEAASLSKEGNLAFGTVDTWLLWQLTGGRVHATDITNASRTMLFNIFEKQWDEDLMRLFDIDENILPDVHGSSHFYGKTDPHILGKAVPVTGIAGDQQAALFGQLCVEPGMVKNTYGTGGFAMMNTGEDPVMSDHNLLTTIAWEVNGKTSYALEGSIFITGALIQWLRDNLKLIGTAPEVEALAASVEDNGGVYVVPAFTGLGAPHWDQFARGSIFGLTRGSHAGHIARASLESIALQSRDVLETMSLDAGIPIRELRVDGGASNNDLLMQIQADLLDRNVIRPATTETTALGAAFLAGLGTGFWSGTQELAEHWKSDRTFTPAGNRENLAIILENWNKALERSKGWAM